VNERVVIEENCCMRRKLSPAGSRLRENWERAEPSVGGEGRCHLGRNRPHAPVSTRRTGHDTFEEATQSKLGRSGWPSRGWHKRRRPNAYETKVEGAWRPQDSRMGRSSEEGG